MTYQSKTAEGAGIPNGGHDEHLLAKNAEEIISRYDQQGNLPTLDCFNMEQAGRIMLLLAQRHATAIMNFREKTGWKIAVDEAVPIIGATTLGSIIDCGNQRFEFAKRGEGAFLMEVLDDDGETPIDVVAWPINDPGRIMTLFGRAALLGNFNAYNPATYILDWPLQLWRTPVEMIENGFQGACIINDAKAGRALLDLPGMVRAADEQHGRHVQSLIDKHTKRVLVPVKGVRQ